MIQPTKFCVPTVLAEHSYFAPTVKLVAVDIGYNFDVFEFDDRIK